MKSSFTKCINLANVRCYFKAGKASGGLVSSFEHPTRKQEAGRVTQWLGEASYRPGGGEARERGDRDASDCSDCC